MVDPYRTPDSDVQVVEPASKLKWKIYFWVILILEIVSVIFLILDPDTNLLEVVIELTVYPFILIGIFGFAYSKQIFFRRFWIAVISMGLFYDFYSFYNMDWTYGSTEELYAYLGTILLIVIPLLFLQYLALYKYTFRSPDIWN